jgi:hypothetical protein
MRRIILAALTLQLVPAAPAGTSAFTDPPGDGNGAPDITRVTASAVPGGRATFTVVTADAGAWAGAVAFVHIGTSDTLTLHSNHDLVTHERGSGALATTAATFSLTGATLTMSVPLAELGNPKTLAFSVETAGETGRDVAPDAGTWTVAVGAAVRFVPAQPLRGMPFAVSGATVCAAALSGTRLPGRCRWTIPAAARGQMLVVRIDGRVYRFRVR